MFVVPTIPPSVASNARLFVIARIAGRSVEELRGTIWAGKPLVFPGISEAVKAELVDLFKAYGIKWEMQSPADLAPKEEPVKLSADSPFRTFNPQAVKAGSLRGSTPLAMPESEPVEPPKPKPVLLRAPKKQLFPERFRLIQSGPISSAFGLVVGVGLFLFLPMFGYLFGLIRVPAERLHTAFAGWIAGAPPDSLPVMEVDYASRAAVGHASSFLVSIGILVFLGVIAFIGKRSSAWFWLIGSLACLHSAMSMGEEHQLTILVLGHGLELFFCALFFFRAFTGSQVHFLSERAMYAVFAWMLWLENLRFSWHMVQSHMEQFFTVKVIEGNVLDYLDFAVGSAMEVMSRVHFTLTAILPGVVLAMMMIMDIRSPKVLVRRA